MPKFRLRSVLVSVTCGVLALTATACTSGTTAPSSPAAAAGGTVAAAVNRSTQSSTGKVATTKPAAKPSAKPTNTLKPLPAVTPQHPIEKDSAIKDTPSLRTAVLLTGCEKTASGWSAGGTAKNVAGTPAKFQVLVFFTDRYSRVVDSATASFSVKAGATQRWSATQKFDPPAGTQCVLRAVRKI